VNVAETMAALEESLNANDAISIVAQVNHQAAGAKAGFELRPTRVTLFGNPKLGTPLMQINQLAGLDLPLKMFAWEDKTGQSHLTYNAADYLSARHGLSEAQGTLDTINNALGQLAAKASGQAATPTTTPLPKSGEGIVVVPSASDMDTTFNKLQKAIENAEPLTLVGIVDHSANASKAGLSLPPTKLIIFGNPKLGTPLMQSGQSMGMDLPQKMLVFENSTGKVSIAYDDPAYLAQRHGISDQQEVISTVKQGLMNLANAAATAT